MIYWGLRQSKLCPGASLCPEAPLDDNGFPAREASGKLRRCDNCPASMLAILGSTTPAGLLLQRILDLNYARNHNLTVLYEDLRLDEFRGLQVFDEEIERHSLEKQQSDDSGGPDLPVIEGLPSNAILRRRA